MASVPVEGKIIDQTVVPFNCFEYGDVVVVRAHLLWRVCLLRVFASNMGEVNADFVAEGVASQDNAFVGNPACEVRLHYWYVALKNAPPGTEEIGDVSDPFALQDARRNFVEG